MASESQRRKSRMKKQLLRPLLAITAGSLLMTGCYHEHHHRVVVHEQAVAAPVGPGDVIVATAPPAPRREVIGVAPSSEHVWVEGSWAYRNDRWIWLPGHYEVRPRVGAIRVPGHWDQTPRGYVWRPGRWS